MVKTKGLSASLSRARPTAHAVDSSSMSCRSDHEWPVMQQYRQQWSRRPLSKPTLARMGMCMSMSSNSTWAHADPMHIMDPCQPCAHLIVILLFKGHVAPFATIPCLSALVPVRGPVVLLHAILVRPMRCAIGAGDTLIRPCLRHRPRPKCVPIA